MAQRVRCTLTLDSPSTLRSGGAIDEKYVHADYSDCGNFGSGGDCDGLACEFETLSPVSQPHSRHVPAPRAPQTCADVEFHRACRVHLCGFLCHHGRYRLVECHSVGPHRHFVRSRMLCWMALALPLVLSLSVFINLHRGVVIGLLIDWLFLSVSFGIVCSAVMVR